MQKIYPSRRSEGCPPFRLISYPILRKNREGWGIHCLSLPPFAKTTKGRHPHSVCGLAFPAFPEPARWPRFLQPRKRIPQSERVPHLLRGMQRVGKRQSQTAAARSGYDVLVTQGLHRYYGARDLHFITCSCYRRAPLLGTARRRDLFLSILEQTRQRYGFVVVGYVVMPEHFHLLASEPEKGTPSTVMQVLKRRFARRLLSRLRRAR